MIKKAAQYYQIISNLSIDVAIGVCCCMLPLPYLFQIHLPLSWYICLPAATWLVYLADHYIDSRQHANIITQRHRFIKQYAKGVERLMLMLGLICLFAATKWFDMRLFITGLTIGLFCLVYLWLAWYKEKQTGWFYNKELFVAITYTSGLFMMPGLYVWPSKDWLMLYGLFGGVVFQNLLMNAIIEIDEDTGFSWVRVLGKEKSVKLFWLLGAFVITFQTACILAFPSSASVKLVKVLVMMACSHLLLFYLASGLKKNEAYRKLGELIFWMPLLYFFI